MISVYHFSVWRISLFSTLLHSFVSYHILFLFFAFCFLSCFLFSHLFFLFSSAVFCTPFSFSFFFLFLLCLFSFSRLGTCPLPLLSCSCCSQFSQPSFVLFHVPVGNISGYFRWCNTFLFRSAFLYVFFFLTIFSLQFSVLLFHQFCDELGAITS